MFNELISIILPVYNAEKYVSKCINSLINQTYKNIELIIIDDGSTDNSTAKCNYYLMKDSRIQLININNSGVSNARNVGIKNSRGSWIMFVDADDWLEPDAVEKVCEYVLDKDECDLIQFNCNEVNETGRLVNKKEGVVNLKTLSGLELKNYYKRIFIPSGDLESLEVFGFTRPVWGKLFNGKIVRNNNILFNHDLKIGEDMLFNLEYFSHCKRIILMPHYLYNYRVLSSSAEHGYMQHAIDQYSLLMKFIYIITKQSRDAKDIDNAYRLFIIRSTLLALTRGPFHSKSGFSFKDRRLQLNKLLQIEPVKAMKNCELNTLMSKKENIVFFALKEEKLLVLNVLLDFKYFINRLRKSRGKTI
ncbi:glycosyltransferase family A protein [Paenibacillus sp. MMO-58]|uniref:glycosyltransferase family A protein n=1 Tax=Paenibacillus sp. MMO-58 TaxID=3081290 RepID=UPI00301AE61F